MSASGNGIYCIVKIEFPEKHLQHFNSIAEIFSDYWGITIDRNCKDIARLRGASYDDNPVFNPLAKTFSGLSVKENNQPLLRTRQSKSQQCGTEMGKSIAALIGEIEKTNADITDNYNDWFAIGRALASGLGEQGRNYFHIISSKSEKYNPTECDKQFNRCLNCCSETSIATLFYIAKQFNIYAKQ